jgi:hypothetical protein
MAEDKVSLIKRRYQKMRDVAQPIFDQKETNRALYANDITTDETYEYDYTLSDPHVFPIMRNYLSRSNPSQIKIRLDARKPDDYEKRQVNQDLVNWELNEIMLTSLFYRVYYSGFMNGKGYFKDGWKYEPALKIKVKNPDGTLKEERLLRDKINRADARFVRFQDFLVPNPNNPVLREQPYVGEVIQQRVGEMVDENESLKEKGEKPYWDEAFLKRLKESGVKQELLDYQADMVDDGDSKDDLAFKSAYLAMVCIHDLDGNVFYMPLKEDIIINKDTTNRYWHGHYPYGDFTPFPEDDSFFPQGIVDVIADLQIGASEIFNQQMTNARQANNSMWVAGSSAAQTPDWQFRNRPDGIIRVVGDVTQIQQVRAQDNLGPSTRFAADIQNKIERASGISSLYSSGAPGSSVNQTARGAQIIDQNIDTNMKMIIDLFGEQVIKTLGQDFLELNTQYITEEQTFFITGKKGMRDVTSIAPELVTANFDVTVNAESMVKQTPASRQASLQNTITVLQGIETQSQGAIQVDLIPAVEALVDATPDMENVDDVVVSIDEKSKRDLAMLVRGQEVTIKVRDAHKDLVMAASIFYEDHGAELSPESSELFTKYVEDHMRYLQAAAEVQAMSQPQIPQPMGAPGMEAAMGGQGNAEQVMGTQEGTQDGGYNLGAIA